MKTKSAITIIDHLFYFKKYLYTVVLSFLESYRCRILFLDKNMGISTEKYQNSEPFSGENHQESFLETSWKFSPEKKFPKAGMLHGMTFGFFFSPFSWKSSSMTVTIDFSIILFILL